MGVRVLVEVKHGGRDVVTAALVNSGYEADEAELHIPLALARELGFRLEGLEAVEQLASKLLAFPKEGGFARSA